MLNPFDSENISRAYIIHALARLRKEWQETTPESLVDTEASVGLLLADIATVFGLTGKEQVLALGQELYQEINDILEPA